MSKSKPKHLQIKNLTSDDLAALDLLDQVTYETTRAKQVKEAIRLYPKELKARQRLEMELMQAQARIRHFEEVIGDYNAAFDKLRTIID